MVSGAVHVLCNFTHNTRWGDRVLKGGDMYESQQNFRRFAANRDVTELEHRIDRYPCPHIEIDSSEDWWVNVEKITTQFYESMAESEDDQSC